MACTSCSRTVPDGSRFRPHCAAPADAASLDYTRTSAPSDLKLGQAVALKFLPAIVENDAGRLQRFLNEVKIARQISHPSVCRVCDVGEVEGHQYLSMEYVDGEDLASLLRRIGRLPKDKAVEISRRRTSGGSFIVTSSRRT